MGMRSLRTASEFRFPSAKRKGCRPCLLVALELDLESLAEDAQGVVIGVKGAVDDGCDDAFGILVQEGLFQNALAGAGFAQDQTEPALVGMDFEDFENLLLVGKEGKAFEIEGITLETKMSSDHKAGGSDWVEGLRSLATGFKSLASPMRSVL